MESEGPYEGGRPGRRKVIIRCGDAGLGDSLERVTRPR